MKRLLLVASLLVPFAAHALQFQIPVQCEIGRDCFVQNYVDTDPSPEYSDFQCGKMTYDGHDGVDFRTRNFVVMEQGVSVIAAAPGTVIGVRDEVEDTGLSNPDIKNKECGNGVMLRHEGGWQTQYCHMKKGSIIVYKDQIVNTGDVLGQIGFSGQTEFPHLHLTVRHNGKKLDPFTGNESNTALCNADTSGTLWAPEAAAKLMYSPTHLLGSGMTSEVPAANGARHGKFNDADMLLTAPLMVLWADIMGVQAGDTLKMQLVEPGGTPIVDKEEVFANPKALQFYYIGRKRPGGRWLPGVYKGKVGLYREGRLIFSTEKSIIVKP